MPLRSELVPGFDLSGLSKALSGLKFFFARTVMMSVGRGDLSGFGLNARQYRGCIDLGLCAPAIADNIIGRHISNWPGIPRVNLGLNASTVKFYPSYF